MHCAVERQAELDLVTVSAGADAQGCGERVGEGEALADVVLSEVMAGWRGAGGAWIADADVQGARLAGNAQGQG
jgi:hypothetical protein